MINEPREWAHKGRVVASAGPSWTSWLLSADAAATAAASVLAICNADCNHCASARPQPLSARWRHPVLSPANQWASLSHEPCPSPEFPLLLLPFSGVVLSARTRNLQWKFHNGGRGVWGSVWCCICLSEFYLKWFSCHLLLSVCSSTFLNCHSLRLDGSFWYDKMSPWFPISHCN